LGDDVDKVDDVDWSPNVDYL